MPVSLTAKPLPGTVYDPLYPAEDGQPMGETGLHVEVILYLKMVLDQHFDHRPDKFVAADMFFYYERGNPRANKSPDVMFIPGVGGHQRISFRLWEEARGPSVIFEITSENTWRIDLGEKRDLYARLGVEEYFIFDPQATYIDPALQGFRLEGGQYMPLTPAADGSLESRELQLRLVPQDTWLRLVDVKTQQPLLTYRESYLLAKQEKQHAERERKRAQRDKARADREKQRAEQEKQRAEQEKQRAEQEKQRAEQEKQRADAADAEIARLKALLEEKSGRTPPTGKN